MPEYKDILRQIKENGVGKLYLFFGEEAYLREHCLEQLQNSLLPDGAESFNLHRFDGKVTLRDLAGAAESVPFLCERKLVIASDFDLMGIPSAERDAWVSFLANLPDTCCLIFNYDTLAYKPDGRSKIQAALNEHVSIVEFKTQENSQLTAWVSRHFKALGKEIDRPLCEYLIFRCGHGMTALSHETDKIASYCEGQRVTREDIDEVTEPLLEAAAFGLTDAVAARDTQKAAKLLQTLQWMREPPETLLGALGRTLRGLYAAKLALTYNKTARQVMEACGYRSSYPAEKLMKAARRIPLQKCRAALAYCREADAVLKGETGDGRDRERVIEWLLAKLV